MLVGLEAGGGGADQRVGAGAQAHDNAVDLHFKLAAGHLDGAAAAGGVGLAQLHADAADGPDKALVVGQDGHRVGEGLEDDALLLGVLHFLFAGGQFLHAAAVNDVDRLRAQTQGAAGGVHGHVAAAHDGHLFAHVNGGVAVAAVRLHQVGTGQEFVGRVDAL